MASRQPTPRQLAYLDELKMRLQELRDRQANFMEQTAKILSCMSSSNMDAVDAQAVATDPPEGSEMENTSTGGGCWGHQGIQGQSEHQAADPALRGSAQDLAGGIKGSN